MAHSSSRQCPSCRGRSGRSSSGWSHGIRSEEIENHGCWHSVLSLAFGPAVMVDFLICRKVSLGSEDTIDTTARGQSESKVARQHLLVLNRALLRLVASTLNRKCARFLPLRALCLFPTGCWKVDEFYKMSAKKMKELGERVSCPGP